MEGVIQFMNIFNLDDKYVETIEEKFNIKKEIAKEREKELFSVFNEELTEEERFALTHLYAYMPLNDMADHDGDFFLKHIRDILKIRDKMPWGKSISGSKFLHFVLPYRINNENIEDFAEVIFQELYPRIENLSMKEAISEVNHWCHEKATYIGTDMRTVSPLTLMRTALGRCGEQSTLLVAALRSLCIPARQCYTPRWAHCDSNHAWVEALADGTWYFLGACEPEPRLNMGWFSGPARRAMLVNTRVAGNYPGPEEITLAENWFTEINLLDNYSPNKSIKVKVIDNKGHGVQGAKVHFELYNTAEFYPIVKKTTDEKGETFLTTGYGDVLIHAFKDSSWGFNKISVKDGEEFQVIIEDKLPEDGTMEFKMVPPPEIHKGDIEVTQEERKANDIRLKEEDNIRTAYETTFISEEQSEKIAIQLKLPIDRVWKVLKHARGNSKEIAAFLQEETEKYGEWPLKLLESLREKDLQDTFKPVLKDHLVNSLKYKSDYEEEIFLPYIMCPRINYEMLGEHKKLFQESFEESEINAFRENPEMLVKWVKENIEVLDGYNYYVGYASSKGTFSLKKADAPSRNILFVSLARSFGIPARLEPSDKRPQYLKDGSWQDAALLIKSEKGVNIPLGSITLRFQEDMQNKPEYFGNFSLARFEDGIFKTLDYEGNDLDYFKKGFEVPMGNYRLTTGTRLTDGTVLVKFTYFTVSPQEDTLAEVEFLKDNVKLNFHGNIPESFNITLADGKVESLKEAVKEKDAIVAFIEPDREPTKHLLRELKELSEEFDNWGGRIYLIIGEDKLTSSFNLENYKELPDNKAFSIDRNHEILESFTSALIDKVPKKYPMVFLINTESEIVYQSIGYKLGIASDIMKVVNH